MKNPTTKGINMSPEAKSLAKSIAQGIVGASVAHTVVTAVQGTVNQYGKDTRWSRVRFYIGAYCIGQYVAHKVQDYMSTTYVEELRPIVKIIDRNLETIFE